MNREGKTLLLETLNKKKSSRIPWVPYTGVHVGYLKGYNAEELLKDKEKLLESLMEADELYRPDGLPVIFDLQIEAEILGCELLWDEKAPPTVKTHILENTKEINLDIPKKDQGRIPLILDVMSSLKKSIGDKTALYGLICGPFTLASHLRGMNLFIDMYDDENYVKKLIDFTKEINIKMAEYYTEAGMDVIAVVDPMVSQISPVSFTQYLSNPFSAIFDYIKSKQVFSSFFVCGDATKNIEVMAKTNPDCISVDENIDLVEAKKITDKYNIVISGNIPLTSVMLLGNQKDNQKYAIDVIDKVGGDKFILAPGCDMPYNVPKENIIGITQAVQNIDATREFLKNYSKEEVNFDIQLPDYNNLQKPFIEVFTLDSASCAACSYMKAAAFEMKEIFGEKIDVVEYKITKPENIARAKKMNVKNLPSILVNGELKYSSLIPDRYKFKKEIENIIN